MLHSESLLLREFPVGEIRDAKTLNLPRNMSKFVAWQVASLMKNEQQIQHLLLKVDPRFTFRNKCVQPAKHVFVAQQVDHARWKTGNINLNLATKQRCATSWHLVFRGFRGSRRGFCQSFYSLALYRQVLLVGAGLAQWCVEFVVGSLLCSERFFSGYSGFPLSSKINIFKFQFDPGIHGHLWTSPVSSLVLCG